MKQNENIVRIIIIEEPNIITIDCYKARILSNFISFLLCIRNNYVKQEPFKHSKNKVMNSYFIIDIGFNLLS